jgi:uncharacterized protein (DUF983 family)
MAEISTKKAMLAMKCPKCHQGNMFEFSNPYNLKKIHQMPERCTECGQAFQPEPGFYVGAMYVNYGITVLLSALTYIILEIILKVSAFLFFGIYISVLLLIGPLMFRYSRVIFLYMFVNYDKEAVKKHKLSS